VETWTIPLSGHLLIAHLAAYGLGCLLANAGEDCLVGHEPLSLDMEPQVTTSVSIGRAVELIQQSASACEPFVESDLHPGQTGNARRPVIWARATDVSRAADALPKRERLLDQAEQDDVRVAAGLLAGLGAPATWIGDKPQRGATRLDGVIGNHTSDFVRGVLRRSRPGATSARGDELASAWEGSTRQSLAGEDDKTGWSPPGTRVDAVHQWLGALGLSLLPVGQSASGRATTPCFWREGEGVTLPVFDAPVSIARLRCLLQRPELQIGSALLAASDAARLRAFGIREVVIFSRVNRSTGQSVSFTFARGERVGL